MRGPLTLKWYRSKKFTKARSKFASKPCVYVQTDRNSYPIRIGKASKGLETRYRGGTGYALDAAMHESSNLVFVAAVPKKLCTTVEDELIWQGRHYLSYNNQGKIIAPRQRLTLIHKGIKPNFDKFEAGK
jgi:hypothetical protein